MFHQGLFRRGTKITTLFWLAITGITLTTIYSGVIVNQGYKTKKMIKYIYQHAKQSN